MLADTPDIHRQRGPYDFWTFWAGQVISSLGSSVTGFALPLLVYKLTGSALNLALSTALNMIPYLLFGLVIGVWVDRVDRRRLMIAADIGRALMIALIPLLDAAGLLAIAWLYVVIFVNATLAICFDAASFAAIPSLVDRDNLVTANGRILASYSMAGIIGPLLAGVLLSVVSLPLLFTGDALSFLVSAVSLAYVRSSFNAATSGEKATSVRSAIREGLQYVLTHPVIRWIILLSVLVNLVVATVYTQFVLFAKTVLAVTDTQLGIIYAAAGLSVVLASLAAGPLSRRVPFGLLGLGALMLYGLLTVGLALTREFWLGLLCWAGIAGAATIWNITSASLAQALVPNELLGRVSTFAKVLAWGAIPVSALLGGVLIQWTRNVALIYALLGALTFVVTFAFLFTPLGRAKHYRAAGEAA
jgi:MFS family permease